MATSVFLRLKAKNARKKGLFSKLEEQSVIYCNAMWPIVCVEEKS